MSARTSKKYFDKTSKTNLNQVGPIKKTGFEQTLRKVERILLGASAYFMK